MAKGWLPVAVRHDPAVGVEGAVGRPASSCSSLHHIRRVAAAAVYTNNRVINQYILKLTNRIKFNTKRTVYINNRVINQYILKLIDRIKFNTKRTVCINNRVINQYI